MNHYNYRTEYTCAQAIGFDLDGDVVRNIAFQGGCNGNLKAISRLVDGWTVDEIAANPASVIGPSYTYQCIVLHSLCGFGQEQDW